VPVKMPRVPNASVAPIAIWRSVRTLLKSLMMRIRRRVFPPIEPIAAAIRVEAGERLARIPRRVANETAKAVLDAQLEVVRILREASATLDTKANLVIIATGALLTAFVTISPGEKALAPHWALIAPSYFSRSVSFPVSRRYMLSHSASRRQRFITGTQRLNHQRTLGGSIPSWQSRGTAMGFVNAL